MLRQDVVDQIFEAAFVTELWPSVLSSICERLPAWAGALVATGSSGDTRFVTTQGYAKSYEEFSASGMRYDNRRTRRHLASAYLGFLRDLDTCSQAELDSDPIYENFLYPHDIAWTVGSLIPVPTADMLVFDFCRRQADGPFEREQVSQLDLVRPHLARSALLASRFGLEKARSGVRTLELLGLPAALISSLGTVRAANGPFLACQPAISIGRHDRLHIAEQKASGLLAAALHDLSDLSFVRSFALRARGDDPAFVVHLVPIVRTARDVFSDGDALLVVTPVTMPEAPPRNLLTALFDFTPAEARIASLIVTGQSVSQIAASTGVGLETIRSQLKSVLSKTGVHRQVDLVRLLSGVAGPKISGGAASG